MLKAPRGRFAVIFALFFCAVIFVHFKNNFISRAELAPAHLAQTLLPSITAVNVDSLATDVDGDGRADPGDTVQYTVTINNAAAAGAGNDAIGLAFTDTLDANMTLVSGSLRATPIAGNDTFSVTGNVRIQVPDGANDLLANDVDPDTGNNTGLTASGPATSANGGNLSVNANGSFSYNPPPGFEGADNFTYTVTDGSGATSTGTVTLNVAGIIWFVQAGAPAGGDGRLTNPYNCTTGTGCFSASANDPNDSIFLYTGTYSTGITLKSGQKLIGQGATATIQSIAGITLAPNSDALPATGGTRPTVSNAAGTGITLNSGNLIRGLNAGGSVFAIDDNGATVGNLSVSEMNIAASGGGFRADNGGGTINVTLDSVTSAGGEHGIELDGISGGSFTVAGALTSTNATGDALALTSNGASFGVGGLTTINTPATGAIALHIQGGAGAITFAGIQINGRRGKGIRIAGGGRNITTGALDIDNTNANVSTAIEVLAPSGGSISFGDTDIDNNGVSTACIEVNTAAAGNSVSFGAGSTLTGSTSSEFSSNQGAGNITFNGAITNTAGSMITIQNRTGGTIDFQGNLSHNVVANAITVNANTGGTTTFSGASKTFSSGTQNPISLTNNTGATVNFTNGGLDIDTTSGVGLLASGGGTLSVTTGTNPNTIDTTTGNALNVQNMTFGTSGMTFRSVSVNGASTGVLFNNVGGSGGFTVTGTGTTNSSGGTIQNVANRGVSIINANNINLSNINFINTPTSNGAAAGCGDLETGQPGNADCNAAIHLNTVTNATLANTDISGGLQQGVNGSSVTNFSLTGSNLSNMGNEIDESGVRLRNVLGTSTISNNTIDDGFENNIYVINTVATAGTLTVNSNTINNSAIGGGARFATSTSGNLTVNATNNTLQNNFTNGLQMAFDGGSGRFAASGNNVLNGGSPGISVGGTGGTATYNISSNTVTNPDFVSFNAGASGNMTLSGRIANNTTDGPENSGGANSIVVSSNSTATHTSLVEGNQITNYDATSTAMFFLANQGSAIGNFTIRNNTVNGNNNIGATNAILARYGSLAADTNSGCLAIYGNTVTNWNPALVRTRVHLRFNTNVTHYRNGQSGTDPAILNANNPGSTNNAYDVTAPAVSTQTNTPCTIPAAFAEDDSSAVLTSDVLSSNGENFERAAIENRDIIASLGNVSANLKQSNSEFFATLKPFVERGETAQETVIAENTGIIEKIEAVETNATAEIEAVEKSESETSAAEKTEPETSGYADAFANNLTTVFAFFGEAAEKIGAGISPTVSAQNKEASNDEASEKPQLAGETVSTAAFTLPATKSVTITFRATVNTTPIGLTQVSNQGTVSGANFANVLTDDPDVAGATNPTVTLIDSTTVTVSSSQNPSITGQNVTFTATLTGAPVHATGDPAGTVEFFNGAVSLGTAAVSPGAINDNTGTAQISVNNLPAGTHAITARFGGGGGYNANNTSNTINQSVSNTAVWDGSADANWNTPANWTTNGVPSLASNDVSIPTAGVTNNPTISAANVAVNNITLSAGRSLTINSNRTLTVNGQLQMNGNNIDATNGLVAFGTAATVARTSGSILGSAEKSFAALGSFVFPVGTGTGYSPAAATISQLGTNPSSLRVSANDGTAPSSLPLDDATTLDRYWNMVETGNLTANVTFNYLQADVDGNENNYRAIRVLGGTVNSLPNIGACPGGGSLCVDPGANTMLVSGINSTSVWTAADLIPNAASAAVTGRVLDANGRGVLGAEIYMIDPNGQIRTARSNPFGYFRFFDVPAGAMYTFSARHKLHEFASQVQTINGGDSEIIFVAAPE